MADLWAVVPAEAACHPQMVWFGGLRVEGFGALGGSGAGFRGLGP